MFNRTKVTQPTILVTGAAGKTGKVVIQALAARGATVRALVRHPEQVELVRKLGATHVMIGDIQDRDTINKAMQGVVSVYFICPNMHLHEIAIGEMIIGAAQQIDIGHFVYHSVLHPQTESMPHHWAKLQIEALLFESRLPFTILQPTAYMQNILAQRQRISQNGVFPVPYSADTKLSLVDLNDVGEAAAIVLTQPGHRYATYELCGTWPLSQYEVAAEIGKQIDRDVHVQVIDLADWQEQAQSSLEPYQINMLCHMFRYYDTSGLVGNPNVLGWLLRRPPTELSEFIHGSFHDIPDTYDAANR